MNTHDPKKKLKIDKQLSLTNLKGPEGLLLSSELEAVLKIFCPCCLKVVAVGEAVLLLLLLWLVVEEVGLWPERGALTGLILLHF